MNWVDFDFALQLLPYVVELVISVQYRHTRWCLIQTFLDFIIRQRKFFDLVIVIKTSSKFLTFLVRPEKLSYKCDSIHLFPDLSLDCVVGIDWATTVFESLTVSPQLGDWGVIDEIRLMAHHVLLIRPKTILLGETRSVRSFQFLQQLLRWHYIMKACS